MMVQACMGGWVSRDSKAYSKWEHFWWSDIKLHFNHYQAEHIGVIKQYMTLDISIQMCSISTHQVSALFIIISPCPTLGSQVVKCGTSRNITTYNREETLHMACIATHNRSSAHPVQSSVIYSSKCPWECVAWPPREWNVGMLRRLYRLE